VRTTTARGFASLVASEIACTYCQERYTAKPDKSGDFKLPLGWKHEKDAPVCRDVLEEALHPAGADLPRVHSQSEG
jgi:hypothetical protein